jgi:phage-related tail fiber protein
VATNTLIALKYIVLGDGGGSEYYPGESQTALKNQVYQMSANNVYVDPDNPNWIVVEGLIPESAGGFTIREAAIKAEDGKVIAIGSYPSSYKPKLDEGSAVGSGCKYSLEVTNAAVVNMNIDPSTVYATIQYVNNRVSNHASETNAHGGTYIATPLRLMFRNEAGRCQVEAPVENKDAANREWTEQAISAAMKITIAKAGGILPWKPDFTYSPLPWLVWGSDNIIYVAEQQSGPGTSAGPQDPTTTTGYWVTLGEWIVSQGGGRIGKSIGEFFWFTGMTPPAGALVCNGAALSRVNYAELFAVIGTAYGTGDGSMTFNIPDLRGEFIRGWDNGRGVDAGRALGSNQSGSLNAFDADVPGTAALHASGYNATGVGAVIGRKALGYDNVDSADYPKCVSLVTNTGNPPVKILGISDQHSGVTRPRNIAFLPCIQAK